MFQLSEDVVNRMKETPQSKRDSQRSSNGTAPFSPAAEGKPKPPTGTVSPCQVYSFDTPLSSTAVGCYIACVYLFKAALLREEPLTRLCM